MDVVPGVYAHYKGGRYRVLFVAKESTNAREGGRTVVYVSLSNGNIFTRDIGEFAEPIQWPDGTMRPRFSPEAGA